MRTFTLLAAVIGLCSAGCTDSLVGPAASGDRAGVFDALWQETDLHYSFFDYKHIDWSALGARYRPLALAATSDRDFAQVLGQLMAELRDVHVALFPTGAGTALRYLSAFDTMATYDNPRATQSRYVPGARTTPKGGMTYGMIESSVGYVRIPSFEGNGWASEIDEIILALPDARSLIIDIRSNAGGTRAIALDIAGRFVDRPRTMGYIRSRNGPGHADFTDFLPQTVAPAGRHFGGSVYVLTNRRNYSSAEDLVLALKTMPAVTVVGDTTGGASGGPTVRTLPNGWTYQISEWIEYTPDRQVFEGIGLAPDVMVKATAADAQAGRDVVLERALALALGRPWP
ncbi:MAG TPA: S41 family peptidase [Gemmatimonadaceae bacterium]|nr:S41 family peptidase [Gemmatimonadaceae bacterium]